MTPAWLRPRAESDLVDRVAYYREHAGHDLAVRFFDQAIASLREIERWPTTGSPRAGDLCDIAGLRAAKVVGFPVRWYYLVDADRLDVVRLLADSQDLGKLFGDDAP